jgi:hypothetical protein
MKILSLPAELLIRIVDFVLSDDQKGYHPGGNGEILKWTRPDRNELIKILRRKSKSHTSIANIDPSVGVGDTGVSKTKRESVVKNERGLSKSTTYTYTAKTALRL